MTRQILKLLTVLGAFTMTLTVTSSAVAQRKILLRESSVAQSQASEATAQTITPGTTYTYTLFDFPGTFYTYPAALNSASTTSAVEVVGGYGDGLNLPQQSFLAHFSPTKTVTLESYQSVNVPGANGQLASGINDAGSIVGQYIDASGVFHGWELVGTTFTTLDVSFSGSTGTVADGINNSGEIVGAWSGSGTSQHGFTLIGTTYTSFDYPAAAQTAAFAVNNKGEIVGYYMDAAGVEHGFLLNGTTYTNIDPPGSTFTYAAGINDAGEIVGGYCPGTCPDNLIGTQGFLLSHGTYTTFTIPGATANGLQAINNKGLILGGYVDAGGLEHGFLAAP
jgi:probable HAF family extracellular repeat protein